MHALIEGLREARAFPHAIGTVRVVGDVTAVRDLITDAIIDERVAAGDTVSITLNGDALQIDSIGSGSKIKSSAKPKSATAKRSPGGKKK